MFVCTAKTIQINKHRQNKKKTDKKSKCEKNRDSRKQTKTKKH